MAAVTSALREEVARSDAPQQASVVYERTAPIDEQLRELTALHRLDERSERKRKRLGWSAAVLLVVGVLTALLIVGVVFLVLALVAFLWKKRVGRQDLEDRKLHAARFVLEALAPELARDDVEVRLDFRGYEMRVPTLEEALANGGARLYSEPGWLKLAFGLSDGTRVSVTASTTVRRRQTRVRNDTTIEDRIVDELDIELYPPSGRTLTRAPKGSLRERVAGLSLERALVEPTGARFLFRTPEAVRLSEDDRWRGENLQALLDGHAVLDAVRGCSGAVRSERYR